MLANAFGLTSHARVAAGDGAKVTFLGRDAALPFEVNAKKQLVVDASAVNAGNAPCTFAYSLKLEGFDLDIQPDAVVEAPKTEMVHD